ncbi:MAG: DMT family transporter [Clostridium sp.]|uniref:DMT family transporter n=1 Tax=Clostridium sp. TaxID=1506 RepID=UPI003F3BF77B
MNNYKGIIYAILASVAFGLMPIFAKWSYSTGANPTSVLFFRFLIAGIILFIYLKVKKIKILIEKNQFLILFITGMIGYTLTTQTLFVSYNYLSVGLATTLHFIYPVFVCILEYLFFKKIMSGKKILSLICSGIGVYALVAFENNTLSIIGVTLALISGITYGINVFILALDKIKNIDNRVVTMYISLGAAAGMFLYGVFDKSLILKVNEEMFITYILIAVVSTILSIILLLKGIELIGATSASILGTFEPIVSIVMGAILFSEKITFALFIGTFFIIVSTVVIAKEK